MKRTNETDPTENLPATKTIALKPAPWSAPASDQDQQLQLRPIVTARLAAFQKEIKSVARQRRVPDHIREYALATTHQIPDRSLRGDLRRQARQWLAQHRNPPPQYPPARTETPFMALSSFTGILQLLESMVKKRQEWAALVTRLHDREHMTFRQIAWRFDTTTERVRQDYQQARQRHPRPTTDRTHSHGDSTNPIESRRQNSLRRAQRTVRATTN